MKNDTLSSALREGNTSPRANEDFHSLIKRARQLSEKKQSSVIAPAVKPSERSTGKPSTATARDTSVIAPAPGKPGKARTI